MSKAYSNKALPAGTILREWRLEDVLGVGGFGIVYRGRGIYFGTTSNWIQTFTKHTVPAI